mgnify:FL=1
MQTIEQWKAERKTPEWVWAAIRVHHPSGTLMTGEEYDATCEALANRPASGRIE